MSALSFSKLTMRKKKKKGKKKLKSCPFFPLLLCGVTFATCQYVSSSDVGLASTRSIQVEIYSKVHVQKASNFSPFALLDFAFHVRFGFIFLHFLFLLYTWKTLPLGSFGYVKGFSFFFTSFCVWLREKNKSKKRVKKKCTFKRVADVSRGESSWGCQLYPYLISIRIFYSFENEYKYNISRMRMKMKIIFKYSSDTGI